MTWVDPEEVGAWAEIDLAGTIKTPSRLSFSSVSTYAECGELWRLTRGFHRQGNAWWANPGGGAVHTCTEIWDRIQLGEDLVEPTFEEVFLKELEDYTDVELLASGKKNQEALTFAGGPNGKDEVWWLHYGPLMVEAYKVWRTTEATEFKIIAIEHPFQQVVGGELMIGHIDRVEIHLPTGTLWIRDLKTGDSGGYLQLSGYREGFFLETGMRADWGDLIKFRWEGEKVEEMRPIIDPETGEPEVYKRDTKDAKKGDPKMKKVMVEGPGRVICFTTRPTDFTGFTTEYVENIYQMARRGIEAGVFLPNKRNNCRYCGVQEYCRADGGDKGLTYPVKSAIVSGKLTGEAAEIAAAIQ